MEDVFGNALLEGLLDYVAPAPDGSVSSATTSGSSSPLAVESFVPPPSAASWSNVKRSLETTRFEAQQLTRQLQSLQEAHAANWSEAKHQAMVERHKRRRVERECNELRDALDEQRRFLRGMRFMMDMQSRLSTAVNLCRRLHTYTRLPREMSARMNEFKAVAAETRSQFALDLIRRETEALSLDAACTTPVVRSEYVDDGGGLCVTSMSVYALDTDDLAAVVRGARSAVHQIVSLCPSNHVWKTVRDTVDPVAPATSSTLQLTHRVLDVTRTGHGDTGHQCNSNTLVHSHIVTMHKQATDHALMMWDYVDDDELFPRTETAVLSRECVGACLIQREMCSDGVMRLVVRSVDTKRFRPHEAANGKPIGDFVCLSDHSMHANELLFRTLVLKEMTGEEDSKKQ